MQCHSKCHSFCTKIQEYAKWDFCCLHYPNFNWESKDVNEERDTHCEACLTYYDSSIEDLQCYWREQFAGDHCQVQEMLLVVEPILTEETFQQLAPGYVDGVPNFFHAEVPYSEFQFYKAYATQQNINKHPLLVQK